MYYQKNGELREDAKVTIEDRAFLYGDGCFTTARFKDGKIVIWDRHIERLSHAIHTLKLNCTVDEIGLQAEKFCASVTDEGHSYGTIKILISRGISARGYALPDSLSDIYFYFYPAVFSAQPSKVGQIGLMNEPLGSLMPCLRGIKTLNRLEQIMLKTIAQQQGLNEALCFDVDNNLVEAISSNCFIYLNGVWVTPDLARAGIYGTMRAEILARMQHYQIPYQVRIISHTEITQIEAAFLCNALQPMQVIQQLNIRLLDETPCHQLFQAISLHQLV